MVALAAFLAREWLRARSVANALLVEAKDGFERTTKHLSESDYDALIETVRNDAEHIPFISSYPPPHHLYRMALDEIYLFPRALHDVVNKTHKAEIEAEEFIRNLQTDVYRRMSIERRVKYVNAMKSAFLRLSMQQSKLSRLLEESRVINPFRR